MSDDLELAIIFGSIIVGFFLLIYLGMGIPDIIGRAINPEYHALQDIIEMVKGQK